MQAKTVLCSSKKLNKKIKRKKVGIFILQKGK